ncbi:MAG: FAD:protein FMN transferase [Saprospiraceae bacterium]|nr:FAD:protein FMN transferase [Saprospiraceae bacterium]
MKRRSFYLAILLVLGIVLVGCKRSETTSPAETYLKIKGETMGTYYQVTYQDALQRDLKAGIDSLLIALNQEVSTYIETSVISRFNQSTSGLEVDDADRHFVINLLKSREIYRLSGGAFDPTVMPLVNYWGFGYSEKHQIETVDSQEVAHLQSLVDLSAITGVDTLGPGFLAKPRPDIQLDFSALAKGYGVDLVGLYLRSLGVTNFLVDIGGEALASGVSPRGTAWRIGINVPAEEAALNALYTSLDVSDKALATSGNYRNLYEVDGVKYSHTINPKTGYPERRRLLSASIMAADCMTADALATTCMVLGLDKAKELIGSLSGVDAYLIFSAEDGRMTDWASPGMSSYSPTR